MLGGWHFQTWTRLIPHMPIKKLGAQQCRPSPGTETRPGTPSLTALGLCRLLIRPTKPTHLPTLCDMEGFLACHWETEVPGGPPGGTLGSCAVSRCVILRRYNKVSGPGSGASAQCQGLNPGWDPCGLGMLPPTTTGGPTCLCWRAPPTHQTHPEASAPSVHLLLTQPQETV